MKSILIVGATGAQGGAIVETLSSTNEYNILAFTRSETSSQAKTLASLPNVKLVVNNASSGYDVEVFSRPPSLLTLSWSTPMDLPSESRPRRTGVFGCLSYQRGLA